MYFALYTAHWKGSKGFGALAMIISFIGVAVFLATNRAFSMLELSGQYAQATTEAQRSMLAAAGQAMLSVGRSHSPGTFIGFFLGELAGILMSVVMLRGKIFNKATALIGIIGFTLLSIFEVCTSFIPGLKEVAMIFAIGGGLLNVIWLILLGRRLFQLVLRTNKEITIMVSCQMADSVWINTPNNACTRPGNRGFFQRGHPLRPPKGALPRG